MADDGIATGSVPSNGPTFTRQLQYQARAAAVFVASLLPVAAGHSQPGPTFTRQIQYQALTQPILVTPRNEDSIAAAAGHSQPGPVFTRQFLYQAITQPVATIPNANPGDTITIDKWWTPLTEPPDGEGIGPEYQGSVYPIAITSPAVDVPWAGGHSQPGPTFTRQLQYPAHTKPTLAIANVDPNTLPASAGFSQPGPTFTRQFQYQAITRPPAVIPNSADTVTVDKWLVQLSQPHDGEGIGPEHQVEFTFLFPQVADARISTWFAPLSEPRRYPPALSTALQQALFQPQLVSVAYTVGLSDFGPVFTSQLQYQQTAEPFTEALPPPPPPPPPPTPPAETSSGGWTYDPWARPGRRKVRRDEETRREIEETSDEIPVTSEPEPQVAPPPPKIDLVALDAEIASLGRQIEQSRSQERKRLRERMVEMQAQRAIAIAAHRQRLAEDDETWFMLS